MGDFGQINEVNSTGNTCIFGYLPKDVLDNIKYLFKLPELDIVEIHDCGSIEFYLHIKYQYVTTKLHILSLLSYQKDRIDFNLLKEFIDDLSNNIKCYYDQSQYDEYDESSEIFEIEYRNNIITIYTKDREIDLSIESKDQLVLVLRKYYDMLNKK